MEREREREERREEENAVRRAVVGVVAMVVRGSGSGSSGGGGGRREEDGVEDRLGICVFYITVRTYQPWNISSRAGPVAALSAERQNA